MAAAGSAVIALLLLWACVPMAHFSEGLTIINLDRTPACGWNTTALNGTVQSPNFPANYSNNQSCVYIITAPAGYQVTLNFTDLDIDPTPSCFADFVEIRDGDQSSPAIGRYCNRTIPRQRRTFGNQMWIKFASNGTGTAQGFRATFVSAKLQAPYVFLAASIPGNRFYGIIFRVDVETISNYIIPMSSYPTWPVAVDFDPVEQTLYLTEVGLAKRIGASSINGSGMHTIRYTGPDSVVEGLAVDPLSRLIFYTDSGRNMIAMVTMSTLAHRTILNSSLDQPRAIVLNTAEGLMFWAAGGAVPKIEGARYDGSDRRTLVTTRLSHVNGMALDVSKQRLYWVDGGTNTVEMFDLESKGRTVLHTANSSHYLFGLTLLNNTLYMSDWLGENSTISHILSLEIGSPNLTYRARATIRVNGIKVVQPRLFSNLGVNGCGSNNGGCGSICIPLPNNSSKCMCPDGQTLTRNHTSCVDACPEQSWGVNCSQTCNCSQRATCDVLEGCVCLPGWSGVTCSTDVNECETMTNVCPENHICQNNPGSFVCLCRPGFVKEKNTLCVDIDECAVSSNNTCQQVCTNTPGSYVCSCHEGYTYHAGNNTCTVAACPANQWGVHCNQTCNCSNQGTCNRTTGCVCHSGWSGVTCSTDVNECEMMTNACPENQTCANNPGSFVCLCPPGLQKNGNACIEQTQFLDFGSLQGDSTLPKGQKKLSAEVSVPSGLPIAGNIATEVFVSMNGLISFGRKYDSFSARSLPVPGFELMCGYWTDMQLPTTDNTANVWYQVYHRSENNTAKDSAMLTMGGNKVNQYANISGYLPVFMLVVTFENVPLDGASTSITEKVTFQMSVVSDGFTTYGLVTYDAIGMQVDSSLGRPVTIGYLSTNIDIISPATETGNTGQQGRWFFTLSTEVNNFKQKCRNWYLGQLPQVSQYIKARSDLPVCPCIKSLAQLGTSLLAEEVKDEVACFLSAPISPDQQHAQRCCYNQTTGSFLQTRPFAGSFLLFHPTVNASGHFLMDTLPKQYCCQKSQLCDKYYQVRPISTCQHTTIFQSLGTGDPHITTLDGKTFSFNAVGEFTLLRFDTPRFELQTRTCVATSRNGTTVAASVFCAFAAKGANSTFQVEMNRKKTSLNVRADKLDLSKQFQTDPRFNRFFPGLLVERTKENSIKAFFGEGIGLTVSVKHRQLTIHIAVHFNTSGSSPSGLLGNLNGDPQDDFIFPNGTTLPGNTSEQDLLNYGKAWAITDESSLFVYEGNFGTSYYTNESFQPLFLSDIPDQKLAEAQGKCGDAKDLSCIYDFFATDDEDLAKETKADGSNLTISIEIAGNRVPFLTGPSRLEVTLGQTTSVTFIAKDEDGAQGLQVVFVDQPPGWQFDAATGIGRFTPGSTKIAIVAAATDSKGAMSPSLRVTIVACSGCSGNGDCNTEKLRPTDDEFFLWRTCDCLPYYSGDDCAADRNACVDDLCPLQTSCTDLTAEEHRKAGPSSLGYNCSDCPAGYLWNRTDTAIICQDIDECRFNPSPCQHFCTNTIGSYLCSCKPGYRKDVTNQSLCRDINECQERTHDCHQQCVNTQGSFHCSCFQGFALNTTDNRTCVRETAADPCAALSPPCSYACKNESGALQCLCASGYALAADQRSCEDINECTLNQCSQKCDNTNGSYTCSCLAGFRLDADKVTCNACPANRWGDNCSQTCDCRGRGKCNKVRGCDCHSGWSGVTCSTDVNECETIANACPANQICQNNPGSFACICPPGFQKVNNTACVDINECAVSSNNTCQQVCTNTPGSYVCSCHEGYTYDAGNNICTDINECDTNILNCEYKCENFPGAANCICGPGSVLNDDRRTCVKEQDPCASLATSKNCSYACQVVNGSALCDCAAGFKLKADGATCQDINECSGNHSCNQVCHNTEGNYRCSCSTGYTLDSDQRTCVECDGNHWGDNCNMTCDCNPVGTQRCDKVTGCVCRSGWQGAQCEQDVDECSATPCSNMTGAQCVNTTGSFRCLCGGGYVMNAKGDACVDINECQQQPGPCDQHCNNTAGSYLCSCQQGFQANGTACIDVDECLNKPCEQICRNTVGGYFCECRPGFIPNDTTRSTCTDIDECLSSPCDYSCNNTAGSYVCMCPMGYQLNATTRHTCQDTNECESNPCINGICSNAPGNFSCSCPPGFYMLSDQLTCQACDAIHYGPNCSGQCTCERANTADCNDVNGSCTCKGGWTGENCTEDVDECSNQATKPCRADTHATCNNTEGSYVCHCVAGYVRASSGEKCRAPDINAISSTTIAAASAGGVLAIISVVGIVLVVVKRRRRARRNNSPLTDQSEPAGSKDSDIPARWLSPADQGHPYASQGHPPEGQGHPIVGQGPPKAGQGPRYVENAAFSASSQAPPNSEMGYWRPVQLEADDEENSEGWVAYTQAQAPPELGSHSSLSSAHQPQHGNPMASHGGERYNGSRKMKYF